MATPYLRRGLRAGERVVTTTGTSYVTDALRPNDYLSANWGQRTGSTPFTGAYYHTVVIANGHYSGKPISMKNPGEMIQFPSGDRDGQRRHYPRQIIQIEIKYLAASDYANFQLFFQKCGGSSEVIELVDENSNAIPCRWTSDLSTGNDLGQDVARPHNLNITLEVEHVSELYTMRSGGLVTY